MRLGTSQKCRHTHSTSCCWLLVIPACKINCVAQQVETTEKRQTHICKHDGKKVGDQLDEVNDKYSIPANTRSFEVTYAVPCKLAVDLESTPVSGSQSQTVISQEMNLHTAERRSRRIQQSDVSRDMLIIVIPSR